MSEGGGEYSFLYYLPLPVHAQYPTHCGTAFLRPLTFGLRLQQDTILLNNLSYKVNETQRKAIIMRLLTSSKQVFRNASFLAEQQITFKKLF